MTYNVDFEICSIIFLCMLMILSSTRKNLENYQSRLFRVYLLGGFLNNCLDVVSCFTLEYYDTVPLWINIILNMVFLVIQCFLPTIFVMYVYRQGTLMTESAGRNLMLFFLPASISAGVVVSSVWTKFIFYFDETGYHHGSLHNILYINVAIYFIVTVAYVIYKRKILKEQCFVIGLMLFVTALPVAVQFLVPNYMLAGVGSALSIFIIYLTHESHTSYLDKVTGAMSREAFIFHVRETYRKGLPAQIFVIALDNFKLINDSYGMDGGDEILVAFTERLQEEYSETNVFRLEGDTFVVLLGETTEGAKELDRIRRILQRKWQVKDSNIEISAGICLLHSIHHKAEDIIPTIEYGIVKVKELGMGQFLEIDESVVADMERRNAIEQAIYTAIENKHFEVHYQPILDTHTKRFHSMEALARLQVEGYGYVSPEEFIKIAEKNGTIVQIGILVLEEVCDFISACDLTSKGIDFVEVNLSVAQCMQERLYASIRETLDRYNIPPQRINLEITESTAAFSEQRLVQNIARLSIMDITFSLDDYGSGYSNINYLVDLPFSIVKIDKYFVWNAMKEITSRKILEHTITMFKDINLKVVAEGIEDLEMARVVTDMGADYLQGYYYSKPVPREKVLSCLEDEYLNNIYGKEKQTH